MILIMDRLRLRLSASGHASWPRHAQTAAAGPAQFRRSDVGLDDSADQLAIAARPLSAAAKFKFTLSLK